MASAVLPASGAGLGCPGGRRPVRGSIQAATSPPCSQGLTASRPERGSGHRDGVDEVNGDKRLTEHGEAAAISSGHDRISFAELNLPVFRVSMLAVNIRKTIRPH
jgi:hypothetical protein